MTLTDAQARVLKAMRGGGELTYMNGLPPILPPAIFIGGEGHSLRGFNGLNKAGHIEYVEGEIGYFRTYAITPAGLSALAEWEAGR